MAASGASPGSAGTVVDFLAKALEEGVSPNNRISVKDLDRVCEGFPRIQDPHDEAGYVGQRTLAAALTYSDNTGFARVGIDDGLRKRRKLCTRLRHHDDVSANPAMTIGGLYTGVDTD